MGQVVAVTGAHGFVGRHLVAAAAHCGIGVRPLARTDLAERGLARSLRGVDTVVHLAARTPGARRPADEEAAYRADNVTLTGAVARACVDAGVPRLVFVSSAGVLGRHSGPEGFDDTSPPAPHDAYTRSKLAAEHLLSERFAGQLEIVTIRPPVVYGPDAAGSFRRIMRLALSGWPLPLAMIDAPRSLMSVRNLVDLLLVVAQAAPGAGERLLVADAEVTTVAALVRALADAAGRRATLLPLPPAVLRVGLQLAGRAADYPGLAMPFVIRGSFPLRRFGWSPRYRLAAELAWSVRASRPVGNAQ